MDKLPRREFLLRSAGMLAGDVVQTTIAIRHWVDQVEVHLHKNWRSVDCRVWQPAGDHLQAWVLGAENHGAAGNRADPNAVGIGPRPLADQDGVARAIRYVREPRLAVAVKRPAAPDAVGVGVFIAADTGRVAARAG